MVPQLSQQAAKLLSPAGVVLPCEGRVDGASERVIHRGGRDAKFEVAGSSRGGGGGGGGGRAALSLALS